MTDINTEMQRPSDELLRQFEGMAAALLHEALGKRGALTNDFKPTSPGATCVGAALTVKGYPGDNLMLHKAISIARPGDLLVATVDGFTEAGLWGEIASAAALHRGIRGLVTDGSVRDVVAIAELGFPVFSRGISIKGTTKRQAGRINVPITLGGVLVNPGDIVVGDPDGVVVVPLSEAEAVLEKAREIERKEAKILRELRSGKLTLDLLNLRAALSQLGLE